MTNTAALQVLSARECDVLRLMAEGRSNLGISRELYLSVKTVERHIGSVFLKLDIASETRQNRRVLAVLTWLHGSIVEFTPGTAHEGQPASVGRRRHGSASTDAH